MLITGGAGFIGSTLSLKLLERGDEVVCLDNLSDYYNPTLKKRNLERLKKYDSFHFIEGDIRDRNTLDSLFNRFAIEKVIHLAAQPGVRLSLEQPEKYMDINVNGTLSILECIKNKNLKSFVFGSSSSVYGNCPVRPFNEKGPLSPISPYGASKQAGEVYCETYHRLYGIPTAMLRFFTVYGPGQRPDMAINKFVRMIDSGETITLFGDGSTLRDYTFVSDIVDGIISVSDYDCKLEAFNFGNSNPVELSRLISTIEDKLGRKAKINYLPEQDGDPQITYADISKAKNLLGFEPKVGIEEGIEKYIEWYRDLTK